MSIQSVIYNVITNWRNNRHDISSTSTLNYISDIGKDCKMIYNVVDNWKKNRNIVSSEATLYYIYSFLNEKLDDDEDDYNVIYHHNEMMPSDIEEEDVSYDNDLPSDDEWNKLTEQEKNCKLYYQLDNIKYVIDNASKIDCIVKNPYITMNEVFEIEQLYK